MAEANLPPLEDIDDDLDDDLQPPLVAAHLVVDAAQRPNQQAQNFNNAIRQVQIKLPPFWKQDPDLWFIQIEAQFSTAGIRANLSKYNQVIGKLDPDILSSVSDLIKNPPVNNKFQALKTRLTNQFTESDRMKLKTLFGDLSLNDGKPSDLLRKMREKSCNKVGEELLQELWSNRLPQQIQSILACSTEPLPQQVIMADKIFETLDLTSIQALKQQPSQFDNDFSKHFCQLEDKINSLQQVIDKSRSRTSSPWRHRSNKQTNQQSNTHCWFHKLFKDKARKCDPPCTYKDDQRNNSKN